MWPATTDHMPVVKSEPLDDHEDAGGDDDLRDHQPGVGEGLQHRARPAWAAGRPP